MLEGELFDVKDSIKKITSGHWFEDISRAELQKEEAWIEETDSTVRMDEINPEFQERIQAIENDGELQAKVNFALDNWIGTRYIRILNLRAVAAEH